ncbi:MAG: Gfo/Idh/MocA family oxidoreductase [Lentisphaerae bacterium]|nr:Gfo/Idh/MocA family oxidoreductase [Lentisphaerota bacterium]
MDKKIKFAIIGTGVRGVWCFGELLKNRRDAELAALCDRNIVRARAAAEKLGISPNLYTSIDEMAAAETLDAVVITTPDNTHRDIALQAMKSHWNVLIDKPLATNVKDCRDIIECANKNQLTVMMGFNLRHHAVLKRLKEIIDSGVLGKVFLAENREFYDGGRTYMCRWNRFSRNTGGLWIHKGSHDFDVFNWLLDFPKPLRVCAFAAVNVLTPDGLPFELENGIAPGPGCNECHYKEKCRDRFDFNELEQKFWGGDAFENDGYLRNTCMYLSEKDTHDNGIAMVEYENGIKVTHLECFIGSRNDRCYTIAGDRATAEVSLSQRTIKITPRWNGEVITYTIPQQTGGHGGADPALVENFCQVIKEGGAPNSTIEHGLLATAIGQAAELSRREHRMVEMSELLGNN